MSKAVTFLYLQQEEVKRCGGLDMAATMASVEKAFRLFVAGEVEEIKVAGVFFKDPPGRRLLMHPAVIGGDVNVAGIKWIPANPDNPRTLGLPRSNAITILTNPQTGYPLAIMDGKLISDMRTGAVAGVGARYLAPAGAETLALIGCGPINRTQMMALHIALPKLKRVRVFDISADNARRYVDEMCGRLQVGAELFAIVDSAEAAIRGADVVAAATVILPSQSYIQYEWLQPGALVINSSPQDPTRGLIQKADLRVVDTRMQFQTKTALSAAIASGVITPEDTVEIGEVIVGKHPGRRSPAEIILYSPLGMGMHDIINANRVYENARAMGAGLELKLWDNPEWF